MAENQLPQELVQKLDPNRRKFIVGILAAGMTAPSVASFVMGKANKSTSTGTPIRPASLIDASGNFSFIVSSNGNLYPGSSANYFYNNISGNFLRDGSGNFELDPSGTLQCGTSGNILLDMSGNAIPSGNIPYTPDPSGNWIYNVSGNGLRIPFRDPSGNAMPFYGLDMDPSGNTFRDNSFKYDSNGVIDYGQQTPGLACTVSANHIEQLQVPPTSTTSAPTSTTSAPTSTTSAPTSTSTVAPTTTSPAVNQNGSPSTTTVPVTPIIPNGTIPATN